MTQSQERRRFSRVPFNAWTELRQQQHSWQCRLIDLSLKGLLIAEPEKCAVDPHHMATATIRLADQTEIRMKVKLVRQQEGHLAFACQGIDVESISHLRRLVELNLGDPRASERELNELMSPISDED
ncbi:PilZ domain-containing protein [Pseudomaricurvus alkylphenolicus]|jgi:hypothetical protein|uniref:PilZ domain-containing protein n=1 Tax=Pseudomaricurvus alkylphenolicus TaxID=1306991 RepID=UPI00141FBCA8|nr:PilZ domain-containing protein [Pseudomaricurvus alkylphenolicus]NIB39984.1 PilZ domain-containing protein [Pseudomaricurvus alkylphenolicus]